MHNVLQRTVIASLLALGAWAGHCRPSPRPPTINSSSAAGHLPSWRLCLQRYSWWAGEIHYFRYINEVEGGVNGGELVWQECETGWQTPPHHRMLRTLQGGLDGAPTGFFFTHSTPASYALMDRAAVDHIPLIDGAGGAYRIH